ncbi:MULTISPECIES: hypothetical protein [unclassified Paenibacillus]|uniref:ABC transporter permease n=1 Tax=unclassified Paenibacillus TaxID=185978 RepID=UPI002405D28C|nr:MULTISPECIES: hypothetical protein [unclassified Paenibacillus]MDF9845324.1 ABC-2 type transport system permease protein [Paenibacillus sp. PastF-2]MDF9851906.1 ABC-2 type transport system permease protein [Paenibacillus sp. PastM-2]MDF9858480.1 ABC-2 type transport system permease protein [Paenibacillus sp. PastF-1]MDH6483736.1 ABC-2 type transport system permease protein [Paenibacillus sp. PastH-2]MDH6511129.1 ABC-2 type transport system permease protein [Paenibacillus sp. PastM-3]
MRDFLSAQSFYMKKDLMFKSISYLFIIAGILLPIWMGNKVGFHFSNWLQPFTLVVPLSLFFYFIIPIYVSFFATEGFEYGSIKNIIASGCSRSKYISGKYISIVKAIIGWIFLFFCLFYFVYVIGVLITGSSSLSNNQNLYRDMVTTFVGFGLNILYLAAYAAIILLLSILFKRTASTVVATFVFVFGDFLISGYFKDSLSTFFLWLSNHSLTTQIMKFSGIYVSNSKHIVLENLSSYVPVIIIPIVLILMSLSLTYAIFRQRDVQA